MPSLRQRRIGAAEHHRLADLEQVGRDGVHLRRADRTEESDDVVLCGELREGEHPARIGRLVVLGDEFDLFAEHPARLVDAIERDLGAGERIFAGFGGGPRDGNDHADLQRRALRIRRSQDCRRGNACGKPSRKLTPR